MLVISRARGDSIVVNDDITITVVEIRKDKVRLGVVVPKGVPVHRQEVYDAIYGHCLPISTEGDSRVPACSDGDEPVPDVIVELPLTQGAEIGFLHPKAEAVRDAAVSEARSPAL